VAYYYANGTSTKVELARADAVGVDLEVAAEAGVPKRWLKRLEHDGRSLRGAVVMLPRAGIAAETEVELEVAGALRPVYRAEGADIIVLPEVRVETDTAKQAREVQEWMSREGAEIVDVSETRVTFRPASGRGEDALELANRCNEQVKPALAQAHFLRVVPRP